jgi:hypothetical protein
VRVAFAGRKVPRHASLNAAKPQLVVSKRLRNPAPKGRVQRGAPGIVPATAAREEWCGGAGRKSPLRHVSCEVVNSAGRISAWIAGDGAGPANPAIPARAQLGLLVAPRVGRSATTAARSPLPLLLHGQPLPLRVAVVYRLPCAHAIHRVLASTRRPVVAELAVRSLRRAGTLGDARGKRVCSDLHRIHAQCPHRHPVVPFTLAKGPTGQPHHPDRARPHARRPARRHSLRALGHADARRPRPRLPRPTAVHASRHPDLTVFTLLGLAAQGGGLRWTPCRQPDAMVSRPPLARPAAVSLGLVAPNLAGSTRARSLRGAVAGGERSQRDPGAHERGEPTNRGPWVTHPPTIPTSAPSRQTRTSMPFSRISRPSR